MTLPLKRIVLVDDDSAMVGILRGILTQRGYEVIGDTRDAVKAIDLIRTQTPQLALVDYHLPGQNGLEITRQVMTFGATAVVLMTADENPALALTAMDAGASGYIQKPFELSQVISTLETAWHQFQTIHSLTDEKKALQDSLETRKLLEKAKGILMEQQGYSEEEAHRTIQKFAQDQGLTVKEFCRSLIQVKMVLSGKAKLKRAA